MYVDEAEHPLDKGNVMAKRWSKAEIRVKIMEDQRWLERAVVAIYDRQTGEEKIREVTLKHNNVGFNGADARIGTYIAQWIKKGNHLSGGWLERSRKMMAKYAGQLAKIANGMM